MNTKSFFILFIILTIVLPLHSEYAEKKEILCLMIFPQPALENGHIINNPFFALKIQHKRNNDVELKKPAIPLEKKLNTKSEPETFYILGNYYKDLMQNEKSKGYYFKFLKARGILHEQIKTMIIIGDIYFSLSEIDLTINRSYNLEKSLSFYTQASELDSGNSLLYSNIGDCYLCLGLTAKAFLFYNKSLEASKQKYMVYARLQAASFERDYQKLISSKINDTVCHLPVTQGFNFDYIQIAIHNSPAEFKDLFKMQHYVYLLRLLIFKKELCNVNIQKQKLESFSIFTKEEETILEEADHFFKTISKEHTDNLNITFLSGIVSYLKSDYKKALSIYKKLLKENESFEFIHDDILFLCLKFIKDEDEIYSTIREISQTNPDPKDYLTLACIEFKNNNLIKAEMLCYQALKINKNFSEAYAALVIISTYEENYIAADEMIKKVNFLVYKQNSKNNILLNCMKVNESVVSLLKNEKEKAYILLRSVVSVDNNDNAFQIYNRYFNKNEKIQN